MPSPVARPNRAPACHLGRRRVAVFAVVRAANGYGNMLLYREDHSFVQWLHVSKYPPSITYTALELGIMALIMAGSLSPPSAERRVRRGCSSPWGIRRCSSTCCISRFS